MVDRCVYGMVWLRYTTIAVWACVALGAGVPALAASGQPNAHGAGQPSARGTGQTDAQTFTVQWVHDGDTLRLTTGQNVRLAGIDSPELGKKKQQDQYYAREALQLALRLAKGQTVTLRPVSPQPLDHYRRLLADVILPDGSSLNAHMVAEGAAWVYWHRDLHKDFLQRLLELQRTALQEARGMWRTLLASPMAQQAYVGNSASYRFYPAASPEVARINWSNVVRFASLKDAFWAGYAPARLRDPAKTGTPPRAYFMP